MNRLRHYLSSIRGRLLAGSLGLALLPLLIGGIALIVEALQTGRASLEARAYEELQVVGSIKRQEVESYVTSLQRELLELSGSSSIVAGAAEMKKDLALMPGQIGVPIAEARAKVRGWYLDVFGPEYAKRNPSRPMDFGRLVDSLPDSTIAVQYVYIVKNPYPDHRDRLVDGGDPSAYTAAHKLLHPQILDVLEHSGFTDLHIADAETGALLYTSAKEPDIGNDLFGGPLKDSGMAESVKAVATSRQDNFTFMSDFAPFYPAQGEVSSFVSVPIMADGKLIAVLIGQFPIDNLNQRMTYGRKWKEVGLGDSGETYLVGQDAKARSVSRFLAEDSSAFVKLLGDIGVAKGTIDEVQTNGTNVGIQSYDTQGVREGLAGKAGIATYPDYRKIPVLGYYTPVNVLNNKWALLAEIDVEEAFRSVTQLRDRLLLFGGVTLAVLSLIGVLVARRLAKSINEPLAGFQAVVQRVAAGETSARVKSASDDEVGELARAFDKLLDERVATLELAAKENEALNNSVIEIMQSVALLARRDLTVRVPVSADVTGAVADAINLMTGETAKALRQVSSISSNVAEASSKVSERSDEVLQVAQGSGSEASAASQELSQAARALNEIAGQARQASKSAENAISATGEAMNIVRATVEGISMSRDQIRETEKRVKRLGERSQEISSVVGIIGQIAERTSVLALNASMQAVAAGDAGRGFAVVADEVKRLAENARQATQQISSLVNAIHADTVETTQAMNSTIQQVVDISKLAERAGGQMQQTRATTEDLVSSVRGIVTTTEAQARSSDVLINRARQLLEANQRTLMQLSEQRKETENLQSFSKGLLDTVQMFKLPA